MTSHEFVKEVARELVSKFPGARVRYWHDLYFDYHYVEVTPLSFFENDAAYHEWEAGKTFDFLSRFSCEGISFLSEKAVVGLQGVDFEIAGSSCSV